MKLLLFYHDGLTPGAGAGFITARLCTVDARTAGAGGAQQGQGRRVQQPRSPAGTAAQPQQPGARRDSEMIL